MTGFAIFGQGFGQSLITGETGYVGLAGSIYTGAEVAGVTANGDVTLTVLGSVTSGFGAVRSQDGSLRLTLGQDAAMISTRVNGASVDLVSSGADIVNAGLISGDEGVFFLVLNGLEKDLRIVNSGQIVSTADFGSAIYANAANGAAYINNSGLMASSAQTATIYAADLPDMFLVNSGTLSNGHDGLGLYSAGTVNLRNTGQITGGIYVSSGLTLFNAGVIDGWINAQSDYLRLTNAGATEGGVSGSDKDDVILNDGDISGVINLNEGADFFENTGRVLGDVIAGDGDDLIHLTGGFVSGLIFGGDGNDTFWTDRSTDRIEDAQGGYDVVHASVNFQISLGIEELQLHSAAGLVGVGNTGAELIFGDVGSDTLRGLAGNDQLLGGSGDNLLNGGAGNDIMQAGDGNDVLLGGSGDDTLVATLGDDVYFGGSGSDTLQLVNLVGTVVNLATRVMTASDGGDYRIGGIETVLGGISGDQITGNAGDNRLNGGGGRDTLAGGDGNDMLIGGAAADQMSGELGIDTFVFLDKSESTSANRDTITGFELGADLLDLSRIDANVVTVLDQGFAFVGTDAFSGVGPQVRLVLDAVAHTTAIQVRLAGSVANDMVIMLNSDLFLTSANFVL